MKTYNVILAAGITRGNTRLIGTLNPICGKPAIHWILSSIEKTEDTIVAVSDKNKPLIKYLNCTFPKTKIVKVEDNCTICQSLSACLDEIDEELPINLIFADTYSPKICENNNDSQDIFYVSDDFFDSNVWALVECDENGNIAKFYDKKSLDSLENKKALIGYFKLSSSDKLKESFDYVEPAKCDSIIPILKSYSSKKNVKVINENDWIDFGHIRGIAEARKKFLTKQTREFNSINLESELGVITKNSMSIAKLRNEYIWYKELPPEINILSPRVLDYKENEKFASLTMELYGYSALAELWVYGNGSLEEWSRIIEHIFTIQNKLRSYKKTDVVEAEFKDIYIKKTQERFYSLKNKVFPEISKVPTIFINGKEYKNLPLIEKELFTIIEKNLLNSDEQTIVHGDLCFSNILFDPQYYILKLIDPRGSFGGVGIYGDPRYDIAKLRHSVIGMYDFIVAGFFILEEEKNYNYTFSITPLFPVPNLKNYFNMLTSKFGYNTFEIELIEVLLFLTMIPLHGESKLRQKAFYLTAIQKLNDIVK